MPKPKLYCKLCKICFDSVEKLNKHVVDTLGHSLASCNCEWGRGGVAPITVARCQRVPQRVDTVQGGAVPMEQFMALTRIPILILYAVNQPGPPP